MDKWIIDKKIGDSVKLKNPILIEGLPGIGNVGKIAVDFLIDQLEHKVMYTIYSTSFPHSVFVNDNNVIEMPSVTLYNVRLKERDLILLSGDVQPVDEESSYEFSNLIVDLAHKHGCKEIITLGGIGLGTEPNHPKVYGVANSEAAKERFSKLTNRVNFKKMKADAIIGATGLILGLSKFKKMFGVSLLVETFGHQFHIGLKESKALLKALKDILEVEVKLSDLDKEIKREEKEKVKSIEDQKKVLSKTVKRMYSKSSDTSYIG